MRKLLIIIAAMLFLIAGCTDGGMKEEEIPVSAEDAMKLECAVYLDGGGYLVPMKVTSDWSDAYSGISDALKNGSSQKGGVIPESAEVEITTNGGIAHVSIRNVYDMPKEDAKRMIESTAATLLQFGGIDEVNIEINGLKNFCGNDLTAPISNVYLNPAYPIGDYEPFTVWYKNGEDLLVPVTKEAPEHSPKVLVNAMINEPANNEELKSLLPAGTALKSARLEGGTLMLDFSEDLYSLAAVPNAEKLFFQGINMTCMQMEGVEDVKVYINGSEYKSEYGGEYSTVSVFSNSADFTE